MYFLVDSSASSFNGHNLEYIIRLSSYLSDKSTLLVNRNCEVTNPSILKIFRHSTWDFGRYGFRYGSRFTLPNKQTRSFLKDLHDANLDFEPEDTLFVSTANFREIKALDNFLMRKVKRGFQVPKVYVMLRRPLSEGLSNLKMFNTFERLVALRIFKRIQTKIVFITDTPQIQDYFEYNFGLSVKNVGTLGYDPIPDSTLEKKNLFFLPPNARKETRSDIENIISIVSNNEKLENIQLSPDDFYWSLRRSRYVVLPYDPNRYRLRSSGIFAEAMSLNTRPIVPTGTWMSQEASCLFDKLPEEDEQFFDTREWEINVIKLKGFLVFKISTESDYQEILISSKDHKSRHLLTRSANSDIFVHNVTNETSIKFNVKKGSFGNRVIISRNFAELLALPYLPSFGDEVVKACQTGDIQLSSNILVGKYDPSSIIKALSF
jgi:hypothetical protein